MRIAMHEIGREATALHDLQNLFLHSGIVLLEQTVSDHAFRDGLTDGHSRIQRGIRILEDQLQIAAEHTNLVIDQTREVDALVDILLILLVIRVILILRVQLGDRLFAGFKLRVLRFDLRVARLQL